MDIKFLKIKKNYKKDDFKINPSIYWKGIIFFSFLAIVASSVFAYNLFIEVTKEDTLNVKENMLKVGNKEKEKIRDVLEYFAEREKKSIEILNSKTSVIDPSI